MAKVPRNSVRCNKVWAPHLVVGKNLTCKQIGPRPDCASNASGHSRSATDRTMNFTEVKREDEQRNGGFQVIPFAAESVRQARESAHPHSNGQVRSFNVRSADHIAVRIAKPRLNDRALEFGRRVARRTVSHSSVNLNQLAIVNPRSEVEA